MDSRKGTILLRSPRQNGKNDINLYIKMMIIIK